tara:strand:+ start:280 stop:894 length:615 start_codon:yes stop_codon:yes gene_type:complete
MQIDLTQYRSIPCLLFLLSLIHPKDIALQSIEIDSKSNGIIVTVTMDSSLGKNDVTAWQANSGWFYITLYRAKGDTIDLGNKNLNNTILDYQVIQGDESFQIGLRLRRNIEFHEFSFVDENTLSISLRYSTEYFSTLDSAKGIHSREITNGISDGLRKWLYLAGSGMIIAGSVKGKDLSSNTQTQIGITTIIATFIIDKMWRIQ